MPSWLHFCVCDERFRARNRRHRFRVSFLVHLFCVPGRHLQNDVLVFLRILRRRTVPQRRSIVRVFARRTVGLCCLRCWQVRRSDGSDGGKRLFWILLRFMRRWFFVLFIGLLLFLSSRSLLYGRKWMRDLWCRNVHFGDSF